MQQSRRWSSGWQPAAGRGLEAGGAGQRDGGGRLGVPPLLPGPPGAGPGPGEPPAAPRPAPPGWAARCRAKSALLADKASARGVTGAGRPFARLPGCRFGHHILRDEARGSSAAGPGAAPAGLGALGGAGGGGKQRGPAGAWLPALGCRRLPKNAAPGSPAPGSTTE